MPPTMLGAPGHGCSRGRWRHPATGAVPVVVVAAADPQARLVAVGEPTGAPHVPEGRQEDVHAAADPPHVPVEGHVLAGKQRRESSGGKLPPLKKRPYGNLPQGPTRDQIGAAIGISGKTYERVDPKTLMEIYHQ